MQPESCILRQGDVLLNGDIEAIRAGWLHPITIKLLLTDDPFTDFHGLSPRILLPSCRLVASFSLAGSYLEQTFSNCRHAEQVLPLRQDSDFIGFAFSGFTNRFRRRLDSGFLAILFSGGPFFILESNHICLHKFPQIH